MDAHLSPPRSHETGVSGGLRELAGRHALVTGASRGIGSAIARELAALGCDLTILARTPAALEALAPELRKAGAGRVHEAVADIRDHVALASTFAAASEALGAPLILVNNAGGAESASWAATDAALWRRMIELNLDSVYATTHLAVPAMVKSGWGRIVNIASTAGLKGYAYVSAYVAAKHAVIGLTRALAVELARTGVTVNAVCPGYTDTPMLEAAIATIAAKTGRPAEDARKSLAAANPMGRLIRPEEVASAVGWLCLPSSGALTGQAIAIAGGEVG